MDIQKKPHVVFWGHLEKGISTDQNNHRFESNSLHEFITLPSLINLATCQANHLLLYEQNWVTEGTDMLMEEKPAASAE